MAHNPHPGRNWDGSFRDNGRSRALRISRSSHTRLLRAGQSTRCHQCGHRIDLYLRDNDRPVALHPAEFPTAHVPENTRWHLSNGIAFPHEDASGWCRVPHAVLCPARTPACTTTPRLDDVRRQLGVRTRRLIDAAALTAPQDPTPTSTGANRTTRPIVRIFLICYLAPTTLHTIRCVAQTRYRQRCPYPLLQPSSPQGVWKLVPITSTGTRLPDSEDLMLIYDLDPLTPGERSRWRNQHCTAHATAHAPDVAPPGWQVFSPLLHSGHIRRELP